MNRTEQLEKINTGQQFDIVIAGGGATGLGCAVDAASRGYKTLLLEKFDFAKGTSSRTTKLVHGGVRYLAQGNIRLVREALLERGRLLQNAPHVCTSLPFIVPVYSWWQKWYYGTGLWLYEFLSGKHSLGKTKLLSKKKALQLLPDLFAHKLAGAISYFDGQFDDSRLAINLAQTATEQGAVVVNYCGVTGFLKNGNTITGVKAKDGINGKELEIKAKVVINATGVFADDLLQLAEGSPEKTISPSQGIHLVVDKFFFKSEVAMMIPKTDDGRILFAIPWYNKLLVGTTDTHIEQASIEPVALQNEIDFLIDHFNRYTTSDISREDVKSVFAGLRPLAKTGSNTKTAVMPRDHVVKTMPSGLVHITGGKWTTYRSMAEYAIDKVIQVVGLTFSPCVTKQLKIHGCTADQTNKHLRIYGADSALIQQMMAQDKTLSEKIHPLYPYTLAEVKCCIENEMAVTIEDVLARRTRLLFLDAKAAMEAAPAVARMFGIVAGKDEQWQYNQVANFNELAQSYLLS